MLKVLIWQVSDDTSFKDKAIKILEQQHNGIEIVGEAVTDNIVKIDGGKQYDVLLCVGAKSPGKGKANISTVTKDAKQLKLPEEKLLGDWIVCIPGFTLEKYRLLQQSKLSILSRNCFGGLIQNFLGLPFRSPLGNMGFNDSGFIKFLKEPRVYMKESPIYAGKRLHRTWKTEYITGKLKDVPITMMHYKSFEEFMDMWERRKQRINWDNLFVETWTDKKEILEEFDALPYAKKACFVPFKSDLASAWYINPNIEKRSIPFVNLVNNFARGLSYYYDVFDMLLYGKKTPLVDMG